MTGCELIKCMYYIDGKCTDTSHYVSRHTGEDMCPRNPDAISVEEFTGKSNCSNCARLEQENARLRKFADAARYVVDSRLPCDIDDLEKALQELEKGDESND